MQCILNKFVKFDFVIRDSLRLDCEIVKNDNWSGKELKKYMYTFKRLLSFVYWKLKMRNDVKYIRNFPWNILRIQRDMCNAHQFVLLYA